MKARIFVLAAAMICAVSMAANNKVSGVICAHWCQCQFETGRPTSFRHGHRRARKVQFGNRNGRVRVGVFVYRLRTNWHEFGGKR